MNLTHQLRLPVSPDQAWSAFCDPRRLVAAVPGASVESYDGDRFTGTLKVKLGPLALAFDGSLEVAEQHASRRRLVWQTRAADRRGLGTAQARHSIALRPAASSGQETDAEIQTELTLNGRPAQLGRGVVSDAADRLIKRFATFTAGRVAEGLPWLPDTEPSPLLAHEQAPHGAEPVDEIEDEAAAHPSAGGRPLPPPVRPPAPDPWAARIAGPPGIVSLLPWAVTALLAVAVAIRLARRRVRS